MIFVSPQGGGGEGGVRVSYINLMGVLVRY